MLFDLFMDAASAEKGPAADKAAAHEAMLATLEQRTPWSKADIESLVGTPARHGAPPRPGDLGFNYPVDWKDERPISRLAEVMAVVRRIGLPAKTLWGWRAIPASSVLGL